jgi:hypothetical protein
VWDVFFPQITECVDLEWTSEIHEKFLRNFAQQVLLRVQEGREGISLTEYCSITKIPSIIYFSINYLENRKRWKNMEVPRYFPNHCKKF